MRRASGQSAFRRRVWWLAIGLAAIPAHARDGGLAATAEVAAVPPIPTAVEEPLPPAQVQADPVEVEVESDEADSLVTEPPPPRERKRPHELQARADSREPAERTRIRTDGDLTVLTNSRKSPLGAETADTPKIGAAPREVTQSVSLRPQIVPNKNDQDSEFATNTTDVSRRKREGRQPSYWFLAIAGLGGLLLAPIGYLLARPTRRTG